MHLEKSDRFNFSFFQAFAQTPWVVSKHKEEIRESLSEFKIILSSSDFNQTFQWQAYLLKDDQGYPVARALMTFAKKQRVTFAAVGFFSAKENLIEIDQLWQAIVSEARSWGAQELRGPIQAHFWNSYRYSIGPHFPLYGEVRAPIFYREYWEKAGFTQLNKWTSFKVPTQAFMNHHLALKKRLNRDSHLGQVILRPLDLKQWKQELKIFYQLLSESYKNMPDYVSVPWAHFWDLSKDLRYLLRPEMCRFAVYNGEIVGFVVALRSPMRALLWAKEAKWKWQKIPGASTVINFIALSWAKIFPGEYIIPYVGKVEREGRPKLHGLLIDMSILASQTAMAQGQTFIYPVLLAQGSPALKAIPENLREVYSEHILYHKKID